MIPTIFQRYFIKKKICGLLITNKEIVKSVYYFPSGVSDIAFRLKAVSTIIILSQGTNELEKF